MLYFLQNVQSICKQYILRLQGRFFQMGFSDIPWNYLVGSDGSIYEGRGNRFFGEISRRNDSASTFNEIGMLIGFVGNFSGNRPGEKQMKAFETFVGVTMDWGILSRDVTLFSQDQLVMTKPAATGLIEALRKYARFYSRKF